MCPPNVGKSTLSVQTSTSARTHRSAMDDAAWNTQFDRLAGRRLMDCLGYNATAHRTLRHCATAPLRSSSRIQILATLLVLCEPETET